MFVISVFVFIVWLALNAKLTAEIVVIGLAVVAVVWLMLSRTVPKAYHFDFPLHKTKGTIKYVASVAWEVLLANIEMVKIVLFVDEKDLTPSVTKVTVDLKRKIAKVSLTHTIILALGSIVITLTGNDYMCML